MDYNDKSFDIAHSNSVIEHVGGWVNMVDFAKEIKRLAPKIYVQTPNYWFPLEPHFMFPFFHWLPEPVRVSLSRHFALGHFERANNIDDAVRKVQSINILDTKMFQALFPDASIKKEKFIFMTKSLIAIKE